MQTSKPDSVITPRRLQGAFPVGIDENYMRVETTALDWAREGGLYIYFDGEPAFSESDQRNTVTIPLTIEQKLPKADPSIREYITMYAHQNGFLNLSETYTKPLGMIKKKGLIIGRKRWDFIQNEDGSVTFIERFFVEGYRDLSISEYPTIKPTDGRPMAAVITESIIKIQNNQVIQDLVSDKILLLDRSGEELFDKNDFGSLEKKYTSSTKEIEAELNNNIALRVSGNQVALLDKSFNSELANTILDNKLAIDHKTLDPSDSVFFKKTIDKAVSIIEPDLQTTETPHQETQQIIRSSNFKNVIKLQTKLKPSFFKKHPILTGIFIGLGITILAAAIVTAVVFTGGIAAAPIAGAAAIVGGAIMSASGTTAAIVGAVVIGTGIAVTGAAIGAASGAIYKKASSKKIEKSPINIPENSQIPSSQSAIIEGLSTGNPTPGETKEEQPTDQENEPETEENLPDDKPSDKEEEPETTENQPKNFP